MSIKLEKEHARKQFLEIRDSLSPERVKSLSGSIIQTLVQSAGYEKAEIIHCYVSMNDRNEVNTHDFIKDSLKSGKEVQIPKMMENGLISSCVISSLSELETNPWGVLEPVTEVKAQKNPDIIIVPMVAGDRQKNRIGYGKGYYDRFLRNSNSEHVGLLFQCQLSDVKLPVEEFDIPLDVLITESEIIR
jgi:5-formyltetrahydrofolate cyclo-ligase